jgi:diguanylate cyclase (GGDEF)-like protein
MTNTPAPEPGAGNGQEPAANGRRLLALVLPVAAAGAAAAAAAAFVLVAEAPPGDRLVGMTLMLAAAVLAEAYPVQIESLPAGNVSLAAVFVVSSGLVYGWPTATLVALATRVALEVVQRRPAIKLAANGAVYALSGAAAGGAEILVGDRRTTAALFAAVLLGATAFYLVNVVLIAAIVSLVAREPLPRVVARMAYWTIVPFAIMASVSMILYVLWQRSPLTAVALAGPLVAIVLYQRSVYRTLAATRLALTDELTGVGNQRHFHERLEADLDRAAADGTSVALCLIDLDDFKRINDTFGHPVGDQVLADVAAQLRQGGEAFRLGGDEFALLLPGCTEAGALAVAQAVCDRIARLTCPGGSPITVSAGVAAFPGNGIARADLQRVADRALYRAKREGKNVVRSDRPALAPVGPPRPDERGLAARLARRLGVSEAAVAAALAAEQAGEPLRAAL